MSNYRKGASFERQVRNFLEERGMLVIRSAGSKGLADLVALEEDYDLCGGTRVWLIQVKATNQPFNGSTLQPLRFLARKYAAKPILAFAAKHPHRIQFINLETYEEE